MTSTEIEERLAKLERRLALLKAENDANRWFTTALIGSHPNLDQLLLLVRGAIQTVRGQAGTEGLSSFSAHVVKRLEDLVARILKVQAWQAGHEVDPQDRLLEPDLRAGQNQASHSSNDQGEQER